jgi:hypothetical protein
MLELKSDIREDAAVDLEDCRADLEDCRVDLLDCKVVDPEPCKLAVGVLSAVSVGVGEGIGAVMEAALDSLNLTLRR